MNGPIGSGLDSFGEGYGWLALPRDNPMKFVVRPETQLDLELPDGGDAASKVHSSRLYPKRVYATLNEAIPSMGPMHHRLTMAKWPFHPNLQEEDKNYRERTGSTQAFIAEQLETTLTTYRNYLYGQKKPSDRFVQRASAFFGCSISRFMDDPGAEIAGQSAVHLSDKRRFLAGLMFEGITSDDLTDEDAQLLYEDHLAAKARLIAMKNRMRQQGGSA